MDKLIGQDMEPNCFTYLDDIIIVTRTFEEHLEWLGKILDRINKAGLRINKEKSEFGCSQVQYMGYLVDKEGLKIDPQKIDAITTYPPPKTIKQTRRLIGMYRKFIPSFAQIIEPITKFVRKDKKFKWEKDQQNAFEYIRKALTTAPTLTCSDFTKTFHIQTNASATGIGAVLTQNIKEEEKIIAYTSRTLNKAERQYSTTERECLAVIWAIQNFRPYIEGYHFKAITDHNALRWLHNLTV